MKKEEPVQEFLRLSGVIGNYEVSCNALENRDQLDDDTVLKSTYFLAHGKGKTPQDVRIIPPSVTTIILNPNKTLKENDLESIRKLFLPDVPLILIPLVHNNHWSLLYYRSETNLWVSMDSLSPYHSRLVDAFPTLLYKKGLLGEGMLPPKGVHKFTGLVRQPGGWECGSYTLLFVQMVLTAKSDAEIQERISLLSEKTRIALTQILLTYFKQDASKKRQRNT